MENANSVAIRSKSLTVHGGAKKWVQEKIRIPISSSSSLMYLSVGTRSDITFIVNKAKQFGKTEQNSLERNKKNFQVSKRNHKM